MSIALSAALAVKPTSINIVVGSADAYTNPWRVAIPLFDYLGNVIDASGPGYSFDVHCGISSLANNNVPEAQDPLYGPPINVTGTTTGIELSSAASSGPQPVFQGNIFVRVVAGALDVHCLAQGTFTIIQLG